MRQVTLNELQSELQTLAAQVGPERFAEAKKLQMEKVMVVDEDGKPVDPEEIDVRMYRRKAEDENEVEEKAEDHDDDKKPFDKMAEEEEDKPKKSISKINAKAFAPNRGFGARKPHARLKNFKDDGNGDAYDKAMAFGHWLNAQRGNRKSLDFCERNGIHLKAHTEGVNSSGGFLVPEVFETELISLRENYGVARANCRVRNMTTDVHRIPRRSATLTPYFVGEASGITESTQTFEQVNLVAKKLAVLTTISSELQEDAFINLSDDVAGEIAYSFAKREDECLFLGDGTSTYGGIVGLDNSMGSAGVQESPEMSADTLVAAQAAFTTGYLTDVMGSLPEYADTANTKWYFHKTVYHALAQNRALEAGGTTQQMYLNEKPVPSLFGYPVVFSQVLPALGTLTDTITGIGYFGDMSLAVSFGDRRQTSIQVSDSAFDVFEQDELAIRGTERFDINCHDTGDGTDAGPILRLDLKNAS